MSPHPPLLDAIARWAATTPDAPALIATDGRGCTYAELGVVLDGVRGRLAALGIGRTDAVAVVVPNGPEMAVAHLGVSASAVCAPLNPTYTESEHDFYLGDLDARAVVVAGDLPAIRAAAAARAIPVLDLAVDRDGPAGAFTLEGVAVGDAVEVTAPAGDDVALVLHTSGTTSRPKQVPLSHTNVATSASNVATTLQLTPDDRCLNVMPLFHIHGLIAALSATMHAGGSVVCTGGFDGERFFEWIRSSEPTWYTAVPTIHQAVLAVAARLPQDANPAALRFIRSSSASLPPTVMAALEETFRAPVIEAYGMTEAAHQMASNPLPPAARKPGSVGIAAGPEVAIADDEGNLLEAGATGEIVIRGPNVTAGYVANPEANAAAFFDGWFRTGDQGVLDDQGYLTITGRLKEIINRGGEKIAAREIEEVLLSHEAVAQAVAFAVPHATLGEDVGVAIVPAPNAEVDVPSLRAYAAERLASFKVPRQVVVLDVMPVGPTGKPQRIGMAARLGLDAPAETSTANERRTPMEAAISGLWTWVLEIETVGLDDDFFAIGGDSLRALELVAQVQAVTSAVVPVSAVFDEASTVRGMSAMVVRLQAQGTADHEVPTATDDAGALSYAEERMWFVHALDPDSSAYNVPLALRLRGPLDVDALTRAFDELVRRHERLRTTFPAVEAHPRARIAPPGPTVLHVEDLTDQPDATSAMATRVDELVRAPFDLETGPLVRCSLLRASDEDHVLVLVCHHIVTDGWSRGRLRSELATLYGAFAAGRPSPLPEPALRYRDLAAWQRTRADGPDVAADRAYWLEQLRDPPPPLELPTDRPRPALQSTEGAVRAIDLDGDLRERLVALGRDQSATLFMTLLTGFATLVHRLTGRTDVTVGVPASGRTRAEAEAVVGLFVNTLVVRVPIQPDDAFTDVLSHVRDACLGAYDHQTFPFERLVEELRPERTTSSTPLVQVLFQLRNLPSVETDLAGLELDELEVHAGGAKLDLSIDVTDLDDHLRVRVEYPTALFDDATIDRLLGRLRTLLIAATRAPATMVADLAIAERDELELVRRWGTGRSVPRPDVALHELIAARVAEAPDALAVIDGDRRLTRAELDRAANRFAHHLAAIGVGAGDRVAIGLRRSLEAIVAELGVMKAGAAYVPLDSTHPDERRSSIVRTSGAKAVVSTAELLPPDVGGAAVVRLDDPAQQTAIGTRPATTPEVVVRPDDPVWILHTSGSTGRPVGVVGRHRTEVNRALWRATAFPPTAGEVHALRVPSGFVDRVIETYGALAAGLAVTVVSDDDVLDPHAFVALLARDAVTRVIIPSSYLRLVLDVVPDLGARAPLARHWNISGERVTAELANRLLDAAPGSTILNTYGATETPNATAHAFDERIPAGIADVPAGVPLDNVVVKVADHRGRHAPVGVDGEIWVAGDSLALGFLDDPERTADRYVVDDGAPGGRWYRTGDLAHWLPAGSLLHRGRIGRQVKVRGMRVDLDEIELTLNELDDVRESAVVASDDGIDARLAAFVRSDAKVDVAELRTELRRRLPSHMVPVDIVQVDGLPRTTSGKLDRVALATRRADLPASTSSAPLAPQEQRLAEIWSELLERDAASIGPDDDFFDLGGHSLIAIELILRIEASFGVRLPVRQLFVTPRLRDLAAGIDSDAEVHTVSHEVAAGEDGWAPVFCVAGMGATTLVWHRMARYVDARVPVRALEAVGLGAGERPLHSVEDMAAEHVREIQRVAPDRRVVLCGYSYGGKVAHEIACQLGAAGAPQPDLVIVDTVPLGLHTSRPEISQAWLLVRRTGGWVRHWGWLHARRRGLVRVDDAAERVRWVMRAQRFAMRRHRPKPFAGSMTLLATDARLDRYGRTFGWEPFVGGTIDVVEVPGEHSELFSPQNEATTSAALDACFQRLSAPVHA